PRCDYEPLSARHGSDGVPAAPYALLDRSIGLKHSSTLAAAQLATLPGVQVLSVNVAVPRPNSRKQFTVTGIAKQPVTGPGPGAGAGTTGKGEVGLAGDRVYDVKHHGGTDQAVYAYAGEDLTWWTAELDRPLPPGVFGENLTTTGLDVNGALIGEHWRIGGELVLAGAGPLSPRRAFRGWLGIPRSGPP